MRFSRYDNLDAFRADVLPILLEDEVCNNLPVSLIAGESSKSTPDWFMGTVMGVSDGRVALVALCTKPFNMLLYAPDNNADSDTFYSVRLLADELRRMKFSPPGVFAKTELARLFATAYNGAGGERDPQRTAKGRPYDTAYIGTGTAYNGVGTAYSGAGGAYIGTGKAKNRKQLVIMKLDELSPKEKVPGICRELAEGDLSFVPLWEQAFCRDCNIPALSPAENKERIRTRIGKDSHYIWVDGVPVSQAVFGRETPNGAVVTWVYTPPMHRGRGYASAVVGELSRSLLERGKKFCCLFADANNKTSCGIYRKLGYFDVCQFEEIQL